MTQNKISLHILNMTYWYFNNLNYGTTLSGMANFLSVGLKLSCLKSSPDEMPLPGS